MNYPAYEVPNCDCDDSGDSCPPKLPCSFSTAVIKRAAMRLKRFAEFRDSQRCDLQQELWLRLIRQAPLFDRKRAHWNAFVTTVVNRAARLMLRDQRALKRGKSNASWCVESGTQRTPDPSEFTQGNGTRRTGQDFCSPIDVLERAADLAAAIAALPIDLQRIALELGHKSKWQVAREMDIPRTTLNDRVRFLRRTLEELGFDILRN